MNWDNKIIELLEGKLSEEDKKEVLLAIEKDSELQKMYSEYQLLYGSMDNMVLQSPSLNLATSFNDMLEREISENKPEPRIGWRLMSIAASILLLVAFATLIGNQFGQSSQLNGQAAELASLKENMQSLLNDPSVTNRIQAVNVSSEISAPNQEILDLLFDTALEDESPNVRLAAVEALASFPENEEIKNFFIKRMNEEEDSFVKIALIQGLSVYKSDNTQKALDHLINDENTPKYIKDEAYMTKLKVTEI